MSHDMNLKMQLVEPWELCAKNGSTLLDASADRSLSGCSDPCYNKKKKAYWLVVYLREPIEYDKRSYQSIKLIPRHSVDKSLYELLDGGAKIACDGFCKKDGSAWDLDTVEKAFAGQFSDIKFLLIADVWKI